MRQVDQVVMHFARDGLILLKDSPEAQDQMEAAAFRDDRIQVLDVVGRETGCYRQIFLPSSKISSFRPDAARMYVGKGCHTKSSMNRNQ